MLTVEPAVTCRLFRELIAPHQTKLIDTSFRPMVFHLLGNAEMKKLLFHSTKNSGMKFRVFHVTNGTPVGWTKRSQVSRETKNKGNK